jgi:hypothetical protein
MKTHLAQIILPRLFVAVPMPDPAAAHEQFGPPEGKSAALSCHVCQAEEEQELLG